MGQSANHPKNRYDYSTSSSIGHRFETVFVVQDLGWVHQSPDKDAPISSGVWGIMAFRVHFNTTAQRVVD